MKITKLQNIYSKTYFLINNPKSNNNSKICSNADCSFGRFGFLKFFKNLSPLKQDTVELSKCEIEKEICPDIKELNDDEFEILKEKLNERVEEFNKKEKYNKIDINEITKNNIFLVDKILTYKCLKETHNASQAIEYATSKNLSLEHIKLLCSLTDKLLSSDLKNKYYFLNDYTMLLKTTSAQETLQARSILIDKLNNSRLLNNSNFEQNASTALWQTNTINEANSRCKLIDLFTSHKDFQPNFAQTIGLVMRYCKTEEEAQIYYEIYNKILNTKNNYLINHLEDIIFATVNTKNSYISKMVEKIANSKNLNQNSEFMGQITPIITQVNSENLYNARSTIIDFVNNNENLYNNKDFLSQLSRLILNIKKPEKAQFAISILKKIIEDDSFFDEKNNKDNSKCIIPEIIILLNDKEIDYSTIKNLNKIYGSKIISQFEENDYKTAIQFKDLHNKNSTNELTSIQKKDFLKRLINSNADLFNISKILQKELPILPTNQEEYCMQLRTLVKSLGIEVKLLSKEEISNFNKALKNFSLILEKLEDKDFNNLEITQEYPKDEFIKDVFLIVKDLNPNERQKIYDYFGFELYRNRKTKTGFSIAGYPANLNNGEKLKQIENKHTKKQIEKLRPLVVKFSQNNKIISNNPEIEKNLNEIITLFPELRTQIYKSQHKTHNFDLFKHSIKTMQKIVQNPEFKKLNESDKKILLLNALLHDSNKKESCPDSSHPQNGAFDAFYITKKFNLTQEEQIKLYSLIKGHEWLAYVNNSKITPEEKEKREKDVAFDMQYDNFFEMAKIFTSADLKAVKEDDEFYEKHKSTLETESRIIENYITELKTTRPLLPVTKFPTSDRINKAIKFVNSDGSTNLKGIYKDKDGLIVIKFNEVENETFEKIGFEKGSISKGIKTTTYENTEINTGNIKFFAHGLDYESQLAKFNAFSLPDSDALLSVSYSECPERKYRFFRPQGIILDCDTKFIHGGGESDSGSGYGKNIQKFKDNYIFNGIRRHERSYVSNLIKETLNLNNEEYVEFIKQNENKSFTEITPKESREKLIRTFARINSNTRKGSREYNEMFISNPKPPMAVFAYETDKYKQVGNPLKFLNEEARVNFLRKYALENNIPFVVFGD